MTHREYLKSIGVTPKSRRRRESSYQQRKETWEALVKRDGAFCLICGKFEDLTIDHIIPISRGGAEWDLRNLQILCRKCNHAKDNRSMLELLPDDYLKLRDSNE